MRVIGCYPATEHPPPVARAGRSLRRPVLLFLILFGSVVLLAGCDNAVQSSFKKDLHSIVTQYNKTVADAQQQLTDFRAGLASITSAGGDPVAVSYKVSLLAEQFGPRLQADHTTSDQLAARLNRLPSRPEYTLGMTTVANGMQLVSNGMNDTSTALQAASAGQASAGASDLSTQATAALKQGIAYIDQGSDEVFWPGRVFTLLIIGIIVVLDLAFAYWSGKSAKASGRSYWPAFGLGMLLGPVGLVITILLNRRKTAALDAPEPVPGYLLPDMQRLVDGDAPVMPEPAPAAAAETKKNPAVKTTTINCPHCGAEVTSPPFCGSCGKMMGL